MSGDQTRVLLQQWHGGDREALGELIDRNIGWIRGRVAKRMGALLASRVLQATVYLPDLSLKPAFDTVWKRHFQPDHLPARAGIGVADLGKGVLVEVVVIAAKA